jgi:hypothetical protein
LLPRVSLLLLKVVQGPIPLQMRVRSRLQVVLMRLRLQGVQTLVGIRNVVEVVRFVGKPLFVLQTV